MALLVSFLRSATRSAFAPQTRNATASVLARASKLSMKQTSLAVRGVSLHPLESNERRFFSTTPKNWTSVEEKKFNIDYLPSLMEKYLWLIHELHETSNATKDMIEQFLTLMQDPDYQGLRSKVPTVPINLSESGRIGLVSRLELLRANIEFINEILVPENFSKSSDMTPEISRKMTAGKKSVEYLTAIIDVLKGDTVPALIPIMRPRIKDFREITDQLLGWMKSKDMKARPNPLRPKRLSDVSFMPIEHQTILHQALSRAEQRQLYLEEAGRPSSKSANFLICLHASPGSGKSLGLDVISNIGQPPSAFNTYDGVKCHADLLRDANIRIPGFLDGAIGITITHVESDRPLVGEADNIDELLGLRLLHSFFSNLSFPEFVKEFRPLFEVDAIKALKIIHLYAESYMGVRDPHIILCVDELLKSANYEVLTKTLISCLESMSNVTIFVSTLDTVPLEREKEEKASPEKRKDTKLQRSSPANVESPDLFESPDYARFNSNNETKWITLSPLSVEGSLSLFQRFDLDSKPKLKWLIMMANGHPRTLQKIKRNLPRSLNAAHVIQQSRNDDPDPPEPDSPDAHRVDDTFFSQFTDYNDLSIAKLSSDLRASSPIPSFEMICLALKGLPLSVEEPIFQPMERKYWRLRQLISYGFYTNSISPHAESPTITIPRLSLLLIYARYLFDLDQAMSRGDSQDDVSKKAIQEKNRFYNLLQMFQLGSPNSKTISAGTLGDWYQSFHSYWEGAYRVAFAGDSGATPYLVSEFYRGPINTKPKGQHEGLIFGVDARISLKPVKNAPIKEVVEVSKTQTFLDTLKSGNGFNKIFILGKTNPGFDVFILEKSPTTTTTSSSSSSSSSSSNSSKPSERPIAILIECKSRFPESKASKLSEGSCRNKIKNTTTEFLLKYRETRDEKGKIIKGVPGLLELSQVYLVFASTQDLPAQEIANIRKELLALQNGDENTVWDGTKDHALFPVDESSTLVDESPLTPKKGSTVPKYASYNLPSSLPNIVFLSRRKLIDLYSPSLYSVPNLSFGPSPDDSTSSSAPSKPRKKRATNPVSKRERKTQEIRSVV